ncbi:cytochrome C551 [Stenotrophobium rhamnosiphilum]|uniref:Cytochrome C551 n=2 Tax=Stenotrophobium rhamnosiphilum TaxID=2029166 RepID=A0A2T5MFX0_9GAMM|nr:cytochrome C551 [Stenotrophobium rhamnosiphilum]
MSDAEKPVIAACKPFMMDLAPGEYFWCSCGRSLTQPFCDGSHKDTSFKPIKVTVTPRTGTLWLCGCKYAKTKPHCDGTHNKLPR